MAKPLMNKKNIEKLNADLAEALRIPVADAFQSQYLKVIDKFEKDYIPKRYVRTGGIGEATSASSSSGFGVNYGRLKGYDKEVIGVAVGGEYIEDEPYWTLFEKFNSSGRKLYRMSHRDLKKAVVGNAFGAGRHGNEISWANYVPKKMSPTPKELMNKWWQTFIHGEEFGDMVRSVLAKLYSGEVIR